MIGFNLTPYNDDYDETKHRYRVLFRPAVAVQARELTQAQTILQQQVKYLGDSLYKHGSMVVPGQIAVDPKTHFVRLEPTYGFLGPDPIPINLNIFSKQVIQGQTTQLKAQVVYSTPAVNTDSPTLYIKYLNTGINGETEFVATEVLTLENSATGLAQVETSSATGIAISAQIDVGTYYIWGFFVRVEQQYLLLNKYTNTVSTRVGLEIVESIITPEEDPSLTDNAQGSTNYAAPGAHRYQIDLILTNKAIDDTTDDANFVELLRLYNSIVQTKVKTDTYSVIAKELAQRMADANGDFAVRNFAIDVREHLDTSFVISGTATGSSVATTSPIAPATFKLANDASGTDNAYQNMELYLSNGTGAGQRFHITSYVGSTKTAILDADYAANKVADLTTTYIISDATKVNRGVYPPTPFGTGTASKLAVGVESGRAYVDGFRIDTLSTTYVNMEKARDAAQATNSSVQTPIGNYVLVKNLKNIPLAAATADKNFLTINFSNKKAHGSFNLNQDGIGTARVHAIEFYSGTNAASTDAVFRLFLFDITMDVGKDINNARSFYLSNDITHNNNGNNLDAWGDLCAMFTITNINGTGLIPGATVTGPSSIGTEILVEYDAINNIIITEPNSGNTTQILSSGSFSAPSGTTGALSSRRQIFNAAFASLVYEFPQRMVKTVRASDTSVRTSYYARAMFEVQRNSSGQYIFSTPSNAPFASASAQDYLACIVSSSNAPDIGKFIDLTNLVDFGSFGGNPANTTLTFQILAGLGSTSGTIIKLMGTVFKTAASEKLKALTSAQLAFPNPTAVMSLAKADIVSIEKVIDSGNPGVDADPLNLAHIDIKNRYLLDNGQRDYYYNVGALYLRPGAPPPAGRVLIQFHYFAHSGSGDYFSVDSYTNQVDYAYIPTYQTSDGRFLPLRDCLDFRPRKEDDGLGFSATGGSFAAPLKPNANVLTDFQYYLGRTDKIFVDQYGNFNVIQGTSAISPMPPPDPLDGMMLYTLTLNPYTLSTTDLKIVPTKNPRYTMHDIGKLEGRIANLEYYTSLNQLEQNTANLQITDTSTGLDRFKNGFVVDNFTGHSVGNVFDPNYKCAVDPTNGTLRPTFTQNTNTLVLNINASSGYEERCKIGLLPYTDTIAIQQPFATDTININPFAVFTYHGEIALIPPTDTWKDTTQRPDINLTDNSAMDAYKYSGNWSGSTWGDWQTSWVGQPTTTTSTTQHVSTATTTTGGGSTNPKDVVANIVKTDPHHWVYNLPLSEGLDIVDIIHVNGQSYATGPEWKGQSSTDVAVTVKGPTVTTTTATTTNTTVSSSQQIGQTRTGTQTRVTAQLSQQQINNSLVDSSLTPYIRSRRIKVVGRHFKPGARLYPFFDGVDVSSFCRPYRDPQLTPTLTNASWSSLKMVWGGDFNPQHGVNEGTSSDTGDTGQSATVLVGGLNGPIVPDANGTCTLFFEIPCTVVNKFRVGARVFRLTTSATNTDSADAYGDTTYNASGIIDQYQETITSIFTPHMETKQVSESQVITQNKGSTTTSHTDTNVVSTSNTPDQTIHLTLWVDPVAQGFLVKQKGGLYVTKINVYFRSRDEVVPVTMQIRNMVNGYPGQDIVPFSQKTLYPNNPVLSSITAAGDINPGAAAGDDVINVSDNASVATSFVFDCPVYLNDGIEYAIVLIANSIKYEVYTAKLGNTVVGSTSIVSTPPYLGNLFKSQNASTWVADPSQNMKFAIYMALFDPTQTGEMIFTSSSVQPDTLSSLPFQTVSGSNIVRLTHLNHGMPKGQFVNSVVKLSNIAPGTYNGLTDVQLTGTFSTDNVDLDSYTITVPGAAAAATSRVGPDGIVATKNIQYDSICPLVNTMTPAGTSVQWFFKSITGKSPHNNAKAVQEPYVRDTDWIPIEANTTSDFLTPRMIASDINEVTSVIGSTAYDRKSFVLKGVLSTTQSNLTPQIDISRMSLILPGNRIDDPTFANYTLQNMDQVIVVTSSSTDNLTFDSKVVVSVVAVTGGQYVVNEQVLGAVSGAQGTVVSWDSVNLVLSDVTGIFQITEAISGADATGTVRNFEYVNTITNPSRGLDFSVFLPGFKLSIDGSPSNQYPYGNAVTILTVTGNQITVDTSTPFVAASGQANVQLTMYGRYVAESGPNRCSAASRYITRPFNLANPANSLHIYFTINRPPGSFVDCYFRTFKTNSSEQFETILWKLCELDATVDDGESSNPGEFKEYVYTADNIGSFTAFSIKLVMRGGNSSQVPLIRDFRTVALAI